MISYPYREKELDELQKQLWLSQNDGSRMSIVYGRHSMGKSALVRAALAGPQPMVYLSLGGKNDALALEEYKREAARQLGIFVPYSIGSLEELVNFLFDEAWKRPFSLVLDNFQEVSKRYPTLAGHLAKKWRSGSKRNNLNLVLICGDLQAAEALFFSPSAPLKNLAGVALQIQPLGIELLKEIQKEASATPLTPEDYLAFYLFTGGRPEAVRCALALGAVTKDTLIEAFMKEDSPLVSLCEKTLYSLLGKNSDTYLSILQLVATGTRSQAEMELALGGIIIGGHLAKLENEYQMLKKVRPILCTPESRGVVRYCIQDPSVAVLMRLLYADGGVKDEKEAASVLDKFLKEDLKDYLIEKFSQSGYFTSVGSEWAASARISKKKGKVREAESREEGEGIDIVALKGKRAMVAAVFPKAEDFNKDAFFKQVDALKTGLLRDYSIDARLFTVKDL
ncbi:MAG: hypothetical protein IJ151_02765 [Bacteroidales bacterium]|nr:hypothetical protein [Bacteroidales bacterium]